MILEGKIVVVTGSTRGIGRAIAERCALEGARVVVSGRTQEASTEAAAFIAGAGHEALGVACDVRESEQVQALFDATLAHYGALDCWVNNAGLSEGYRVFAETSLDDIDTIVTTNLLGTLYGCRVALPHLREHGGVLLNVGGRGFQEDPTPNTTVYAATKAAITSLTRSIAAENKDAPVSVHAFVPGMVDTDMYRDLTVSPSLESRSHVPLLALEAFGVPLDECGEQAAKILAQTPGEKTGRVYALIGPRRRAKGAAKMAWWGMTGRFKESDE